MDLEEKRQYTERSEDLGERMAKLKEIEQQEQRAAQSLIKIMSQIKGKPQRVWIDTAVGTEDSGKQSKAT